MADQRVSNERKRELEQIDPFQENVLKGAAWAKAHKKPILIGIAAVVAVIAIFSGIMASLKNSENTASELVAQAISKYVTEAGKDQKKGYEAVKDDFSTIFEDYANTSAGKTARVQFAKICYDAQDYDTAFAMYSQAYDIFKKDEGLKNFLLTALGNVCLAKKETDKAQSYFSKVEKSESHLSKDGALFALAGLYEADNKSDLSQGLYEKIAADYKDSIYGEIAKTKTAAR